MTRAQDFDPAAHLFLEQVEGAAALDWVRAHNARSLAQLEADPRYGACYEAALQIATARARIPYGSIRNGWVYNFWQDDQHERGVWRRTPLARYGEAQPPWEVLLDVDALARQEGANWVFRGAESLASDDRRVLLSLSDGGKDATRVREFDVEARQFVTGGFDLPPAKSSADWEDADHLLVATDWGPGTLTESGYPYIVKRLRRGQSLAEAVEVVRGGPDEVGLSPFALEDAAGGRWPCVIRHESFFASSYWLIGPQTVRRIPLPRRCRMEGVAAGRLLVLLREDWEAPGGGFRSGELVALDWARWLATGALAVERVFAPAERQAIQGVSVWGEGVLLNLSDEVTPKVLRGARGTGGWSFSEVPLPGHGSSRVVFASPREPTVFLGHSSFLAPDALYQLDGAGEAPRALKALPAWFDAAPYAVEQHHAASTDGTRIPYYLVRRKDAAGPGPTLLSAYGGFQISRTPSYSGAIGRLWLAQGGSYVVANIRGGGEFGPAWHQAGLKTRRQIVYDDFFAVAADLIARGWTTPGQLGIQGGSNGGLLMGVALTQRPELFGAVVCQVPLLDMLRYHQLLAGASWMEEYGDPDVPEERAFLARISPYHNVRAGVRYPEVLFVTSTKDDRVHPGHARKMAKRLEELGQPFLFYENIDGGHSAAANQREAARRLALEFTFLARRLIDAR